MGMPTFFTRTIEWIRQSRLRQLGAAGGLLVTAGLAGIAVYLVTSSGDGGEPPAAAEPSAAEAVRASLTSSRPAPTREARESPTPTLEPRSDVAPPRIFFKRGSELWSVDFDGSGATLLASDILSGYGGTSGGSSSPAPSAQLNKVAFIGSDGNLRIADSLGNTVQKVSEEAFPADETYYATAVLISGWSPDGAKIVYSVESSLGLDSREKERPEVGFYSFDVNIGLKTKLPELPSFLAWSVDGESLIYERKAQTDTGWTVDWYALDLTTKESAVVSVVSFPCFSLHPSISVDGTKIVYACGNTGNSKIVIADGDNSDQRVLLEGDFADYQFPKLSPSTNAFIYNRRLDLGGGVTGFELNVYDLGSGEQRVLASGFVISKGWLDNESILVLESPDNVQGGQSALLSVDVRSGTKTKLADNVSFE